MNPALLLIETDRGEFHLLRVHEKELHLSKVRKDDREDIETINWMSCLKKDTRNFHLPLLCLPQISLIYEVDPCGRPRCCHLPGPTALSSGNCTCVCLWGLPQLHSQRSGKGLPTLLLQRHRTQAGAIRFHFPRHNKGRPCDLREAAMSQARTFSRTNGGKVLSFFQSGEQKSDRALELLGPSTQKGSVTGAGRGRKERKRKRGDRERHAQSQDDTV